MPSGVVEEVKARVEQAKTAKKATLDDLRSKKRKVKTVYFEINGEEYGFEFQSIGAKLYDKLLTDCPPNIEQRASGAAYNINTFAPTLLSKVCVDPDMTIDEWSEIWNSPDWNRGEVMTLFSEAVEICNTGLSLGPTESV